MSDENNPSGDIWTAKRGDIWTASAKGYTGKPRPVVIIQDDSFDGLDSFIVCAFTTDQIEASLLRLQVEPNEQNGLQLSCQMMINRLATVPKSKFGSYIGRLNDEDISRLNQALMVFLGLVEPLRTS